MATVAYMGVCHASEAAAAAYTCGKLYPAADGAFTTRCTGSSWSAFGGAQLTLAKHTNGTATVANGTMVISNFPACDPNTYPAGDPFGLSTADGVAVSGAIAAVWLLAWAWKAIRRSLNTDGSND